jgi:hypothetical protein
MTTHIGSKPPPEIGKQLIGRRLSGWRFGIADGALDGGRRMIHTIYLIESLTGKRLHLRQIPL